MTEKLTREQEYTLASRAVVRALSNLCDGSESDFTAHALWSMRAVLTSSVHAQGADNKFIRRLADSPEFAGRYEAKHQSARNLLKAAERCALAFPERALPSTSESFAHSAAAVIGTNSGHAMNIAYTNANQVIAVDRYHLERGEILGPVWPEGKVPPKIVNNHPAFTKRLSQNSDWSFWRQWYVAMWDGTFENWDLAHEVAKIETEVWEGEDALAQVAARIREIEAELLKERVPQAEQMLFDEASKRFTIEPLEIAKPDLLGATLSQLEDALEDALADLSNGLQETSREARVIKRTISKYGNNPQQIEMGCVSAHAGLTRQLVSQELPWSEENLALQSALEEAAVGIRATHPDVAENREILTRQKFAELSQPQKEELAEGLPLLVAISDAALADDWSHDVPALINTSVGPLPSGAPALPGMDEANRIFSRAAKISVWLRMSKIVHAIDGSAGYKAARIVATVASFVTIGLTLLAMI